MVYCEPYQSCALFGAMRYFSNLSGAVTLINGPTGCTFYANSAIIRLNGYFNARERVDIPKIYCTAFSEKDAILGCEDKVKTAAEELMARFHPSILFLFNCCVSEIIGTDIDNIALELTKGTNTLVIPVHTAGFKGDHKYGMRMASDILMKYFFCEKKPVRRGRINLLGEFDYFNRSTIELTDFLRQIGIVDAVHVPGKCTLEQLKDATSAELNIITCQNASRHLAEQMNTAFQIPWLGHGYDMYGITNAHTLYCDLCEFFGQSTKIPDKMMETEKNRLAPFLRNLKGKSAFVVASTRRGLGYSAILKELGIEVTLIFSEGDEKYTSKREFMKYSQNVILNEYPVDLTERIDNEKPDFVFSTIPELIAPYPYMQRPEVDFSGMTGTVRMAKYLCELSEKGGSVVPIEN